jgi:hypothetical protein
MVFFVVVWKERCAGADRTSPKAVLRASAILRVQIRGAVISAARE